MADPTDLMLSIRAIIDDSIMGKFIAEPCSESQSASIFTIDLHAKTMCVVCNEELTSTTSSSACVNSDCHNKYCKLCLHTNIVANFENKAYRISPVKCCLCLRKIPSSHWRPDLASLLPGIYDSDRTKYSLYDEDPSSERIITSYITFNANQLLQIRCKGCDGTNRMYVSTAKAQKRGSSLQLYDVREVFVIREKSRTIKKGIITAVYSLFTVEMILVSWGKMLRSEISSRDFVEAIAESVTMDVNDYEYGIGASLLYEHVDGFNQRMEQFCAPHLLSMMFAKITRLIYDDELRGKFQLASMQRYPRFFTSCCRYPHCFNCQVGGHHMGKTCREIQQESMPEAQYCPSCEVPTIKIDGCNSITCTCGNEWVWDHDDYEDGDYNGNYDGEIEGNITEELEYENVVEEVAVDGIADIDAEEENKVDDVVQVEEDLTCMPASGYAHMRCKDCEATMSKGTCPHIQETNAYRILLIDELLQAYAFTDACMSQFDACIRR